MYTGTLARFAQPLTLIVMTVLMSLGTSTVTLADYGSEHKSKEQAQASDIVDTAVSADGFNTLVKAAKAAGLVDVLKSDGPFTVFAPTDKAFGKLPDRVFKSLLKPENKAKLRAILLYHVVPGKLMAADVLDRDSAPTAFGQGVSFKVKNDQPMVNNAKIVKTDIGCSNGVIHVIDTVILPKDIVGLAAGTEGLSTLVKAVKAANLVKALKTGGPFTVFAPTNAAFQKLPAGTLADLLKPENRKQLQTILKYHVVPGRYTAAEVIQQGSLETLQGQKLKIAVSDAGVFVGGAEVIATDVMASNGVVHVINSVILPE
jgi:uncharacterized surface protein with fasciclin (FAS1) repeats